jgi:tetratricopeptide (TPR) repeat protein
MSRFRVPLLVLFPVLMASAAIAADVFVPPVLKGVKGDAKGLTARPVPFPAEEQAWSIVRSRNFVFISSAGEKKTRDIAEDLETLAAALRRLNPEFKAEAPNPTRVIVFNRKREAQPYFNLLLDRDEANVSGVYVAQKQGGSMLINLNSGAKGEKTPLHELVHNLMANAGMNAPLWLDEGLAEYFGNADVRHGSIRAGGPVAPHVDAIRRREKAIPLKQLFGVVRESDAYNLPAGQREFYARSWAAVDWLMREGGDDQSKFYAFVRDLRDAVPVETALRNRYAKSLDDMQLGIDRYRDFGGRSQHSLRLEIADVDTSTTTTRLERADLLFELGRFLAGIESTHIEAERHFNAVLQLNPKHARAIASIGSLRAFEARYDEALKLFDRALTADPADATTHLAYAEALLETQIGTLAQANSVQNEDTPRFRKARELVQKAIALGTSETARATADLGISYIVEGDADLAPGIAALEKARELAPGRLDVAVHLFAMYRRTENRAKADPLFAILDAARNAQVSYAARAIIMRVELARANALVKDNKLDEAAVVIRSLAAATADREAKLDLIKQADEIARVAVQNREIEIYNKAINETNRGAYRDALKTITQLLSTATDAAIIRDATKLKQRLVVRLGT